MLHLRESIFIKRFANKWILSNTVDFGDRIVAIGDETNILDKVDNRYKFEF